MLLLVLGLSGAALVFYVEIDQQLHPLDMHSTTHTAQDYQQALMTLRRQYPDKNGPWRIEVTDEGGAIPARYYNPAETQGQGFAPMLIWLSADGSKILRRDYWGDTLVTWLYNLHYQLLLGKTGALIVGYAGIACLTLLISGLVIWWPRKGRIKKALGVSLTGPALRRLYDWHKLTGVISSIPLLLLCLTGAMLALPGPTDALLAPVLGQPISPRSAKITDQDDAARASITTDARPHLSLVTLLERVKSQYPNAQLAWIETPPVSGGEYRLRVQLPGDPSRRFPHSYLYIDSDTGHIGAPFLVAKQGPANTLKNWLHPLHDGSIGGSFLRTIWVYIGLCPLILFTFGLWRWQLRRLRYR